MKKYSDYTHRMWSNGELIEERVIPLARYRYDVKFGSASFDWKRRKNQGEIIMSNYERMIAYSDPIPYVLNVVAKNRFDGSVLTYKVESAISAFDPFNALRSLRLVVPFDVTTQRAKLNEGEFDVLTAFYEAYESVKQILQIIQLIKQPITEAIRIIGRGKRDGLLVFSFDTAANLRLLWSYGIMPYVYQIQSLLESAERARAFRKTHVDHHSPLEEEYVIGSVSGPMGSGFDVFFGKNDQIFRRARVGLKRSYTAKDLIDSFFTVDLFTTAWEMKKFSFVLDWVIQVGDFITAIRDGHYKQEVGWISNLVTLDASPLDRSSRPDGLNSWTWDAGAWDVSQSYTIGRPFYHAFWYHREIYWLPSEYVHLQAEYELNAKRAFDALALVWQNAKGGLRELANELAGFGPEKLATSVKIERPKFVGGKPPKRLKLKPF